MKIIYEDVMVERELSFDNGGEFKVIPIYGKVYVNISPNEENTQIIINDKIQREGFVEHECCINDEIKIVRGEQTSAFKIKAEPKVLSKKYREAYSTFAKEYSRLITNEIDSIRSGSLKAYATEDAFRYDNFDDIFKCLENSYKAMNSIGDKPKSHLKAVNEVRPIDTVKRVGYESISYLASHSEDWLARTASGLKPARLLSRTEDDHYQIYENLVVKTLIDKVIHFLVLVERKLNSQLTQMESIMHGEVQARSFGFDVGFQKAINELINQSEKDLYQAQSYNETGMRLNKCKALLKKYRSLKATRLYKYLRKTKPVQNPLHKTNILAMDRNYSIAFDLWKEVNAFLIQLDTEIVGGSDSVSINDYLLFCKFLCGYAAHTLNFKCIGDGYYYRESDNLEIKILTTKGRISCMIQDKTPLCVSIPHEYKLVIDEPLSKFFMIEANKLFWDYSTEDIKIEELCAKLKRVVDDNKLSNKENAKMRIDGKKKYRELKTLIDNEKNKHLSRSTQEFVVVPAFVELNADNHSDFKEYFLTSSSTRSNLPAAQKMIVALPKCDEYEQKITNYGNKNDNPALFLPLSMYDINSYRRIQKIFLQSILELKDINCPVCGGNMYKKGNQSCCSNCGDLIVTKTKCSNPECKSDYHYLSYELTQETKDKMSSVNKGDFFHVDTLYQYKDIVQMKIEEGGNIKPICPYCNIQM